MRKGNLNHLDEVERTTQLTKCLHRLDKGKLESQITTATADTKQRSQLISKLAIPKKKKAKKGWECRIKNTEIFTDKEAQKDHIQKFLKNFTNIHIIQKILHPRPVHLVLDGGMSRALTPLSRAVSRKLGQHVYRCRDQNCIDNMHVLCFNERAWNYVTKIALENAQAFAQWKKKNRQFVIIEVPDLSEEQQTPKIVDKSLTITDDDESGEFLSSHEDSDDSVDEETYSDSYSENSSETEALSTPSPSAFRSKHKDNGKPWRQPRRRAAVRSTEYRKISSQDFKRRLPGKLGLQLVDREGKPSVHPLYKDDRLGLPRKYQFLSEATSCEDYDTDEETVAQNVIKTVTSVNQVLSKQLTN